MNTKHVHYKFKSISSYPLDLKLALILHMSPKSNMWTGIMLTLAHHSVAKTNSICEYIYYTTYILDNKCLCCQFITLR